MYGRFLLIDAKPGRYRMRLKRRLVPLKWKAMKTNTEILADIGLKKKVLLDVVKKRKIVYYGHVRRHETIQKKAIEGKAGAEEGRAG